MTTPATSISMLQPAADQAPRTRRPLPAFFRSVVGVLGVSFLACVLLACLLSLPYTLGKDEHGVPRYNSGVTTQGRLAPSWTGASPVVGEGDPQQARFFLGSDALGRSLFIRLLAGGGISLIIGLAAACVSVCIGTVYGALSGYAGGRVDGFMMRVVDVLYGLPYVLLVVLLAVASDAVVSEYVSGHRARQTIVLDLARQHLRASNNPASTRDARTLLTAHPDLAASFGTRARELRPPRDVSDTARTLLDLLTLLIAIGGVSWLTTARVIRGQVLSLKNQAFIEAARALGLPATRILLRHVLPNLVGPIVVYATLAVPQAILQESFLSFLGIGVKAPLPSWGTLAAEGLPELNPYRSHWWLLLFPCLLLGLTLLALNFVGEGLRDALDPKRARR